MPVRALNVSDPLQEANRCIRDLVALSSLPALWLGLGRKDIETSFAEALSAILSAELVLVGLKGARTSWRSAGSAAQAAGLDWPGIAATLCERAQQEGAFRFFDRRLEFPLEIRTVAIGYDGEGGQVIVGSRQPLTDNQALLLSVATNQAALAFQNALLVEKVNAGARRHEELVNCLDGIVWECDPGMSRFYFVSKQAERIVGYSADRWLSEKDFWAGHLHAEDKDRAVELRLRAAADCRDQQFEYRMIRADGKAVWLRDHVTILSANGAALQLRGVMFDVTRQKQAEQTLRESQEQYEQLNRSLEHQVADRTGELRKKEQELYEARKLEAVGNLAGGVAHDFNNLITGIHGMTHELLESLPAEHPLLDDLKVIGNACERAFSLTRQLLAFARRQVIQTRAVNVNSIIQELSGMLNRLIGEHIQIGLQLKAGGWVKADPGQLQQVLINLIVNARDAMPGGGQIFITTADADGACDPSLKPNGAYLLLEVRDTGCGMDESTLQRIFEPFFTTKRVGGGTGLGLSTVYGIVKQMGGEIRVDSAVGRGTCFRVYFPTTQAAEAEVVPISGGPMERVGARILVLEDEDIVRRVIVKQLRLNGFEVFEARDGKEAIVLAEQLADLDLVISDVIMPHLNGRQAVEEIKKKKPHMRVLFTSGYPEHIISNEDGRLDEGIEFIEKIDLMKTLIPKVRELLATPSGNSARTGHKPRIPPAEPVCS